MSTFKSFEESLSTLNADNFEDIALSLFHFQAKENKVYKSYLTYLGVNSEQIKEFDQIPFLPISFFKSHDVVTGDWTSKTVFESSATTGSITSKHSVKDLSFYLRNSKRIFNQFYGPLTDYNILALLPSYLERNNSSLIAMVDYFIQETQSPFSSFFLHDKSALLKAITDAKGDGRKTILWGVSFALLELAEDQEVDLGGCTVMETGGMKGRREEITREELHRFLCERFNVDTIHSEYGMTELFSQAYATRGGYFKTFPGMKVVVRDLNDPFERLQMGKTGALNVMDLSNIHSCAFVETQDLGRIRQDGSFEVLGRVDNSDIRGCNLLVG
ncbi:MAG: acyl transferase [Cyclobacteriaceae bacterium]|nr:acyl transferase [Cyclobacteriaceae bacterium]